MSILMMVLISVWVLVCSVLSFLNTGDLPKKKQVRSRGSIPQDLYRESLRLAHSNIQRGLFPHLLPDLGVAAYHPPPHQEVGEEYHQDREDIR